MKKSIILKSLIKYLCLIICLFITYCGVKKTQLRDDDISEYDINYKIYKTITYDKYYRPIVADKIERPAKKGEQFHIVAAHKNIPIKVYDVLVEDMPKTVDYKKPLKIIWEWTKDGFKTGGKIALGYMDSGQYARAGNLKEAAIILVVIPAGICITSGTVGFVIGCGKGSIELSKDLKNLLIEGKEIMLGYSTYYYDNNGRIALIKYFIPYEMMNKYLNEFKNQTDESSAINSEPENEITQLFEIQYYYSGNSVDPYKTVISEKFPEINKREILF